LCNGLCVQPAPVVTPEAVPLEFELAQIGTRTLALGIDWIVQASLLFAVLFAIFSASGGGGGLAAAAAYLSIFLIVFGYPTAMETLWRGRTLGKAALGLRVVTREGAPVRFRHAAIRATLALVDFFITSGAVGVLCVLLTRDNQRLGDLVAGTLVLRERSALRAPSVATFHPPAGLEAYCATLDVAGLTPADYAALRGFLLRSSTLPPHVRGDLALQLATPIATRLRATPPTGVTPEAFLWCVAAAQQRRTPQWTAGGAPPPTQGLGSPPVADWTIAQPQEGLDAPPAPPPHDGYAAPS
jgi:uncharacterized RDD family membrane protein YckC